MHYLSFAASVVLVWTISSATVIATPPAFPGAEGFGATASGGRGKSVYEVTTLADDGPGSFRDGLSQGNRTIVFRVSGTIQLNSRLVLEHPNVTIAGQTAPGDGICISGHELFISKTENVIVRFLRIRPGDIAKKELDALTIWDSQHVIVDHCSISWSTDSLNDVVKGSGNVTVQWSLLAEPLNQSVHLKGAHGYATGWDGRIIPQADGTIKGGGGSYHHNLIVHAASRAPRIGYFKEGRGLIDCRNNVIYNSGPSYGGETDDFNYINNYYRPGPSTEGRRTKGELFAIWSADSRMYQAGNIYEGVDGADGGPGGFISFKEGVSANGIVKTTATADQCLVEVPFEVPAVSTQPAIEAYSLVVERAGALLPKRDAVDARVIQDVLDRTGKLIDSQDEVGGWPLLQTAAAPTDTDHDGMPDDWELANDLNPNDPADGAALTPDGYTWLEKYLNSLVTW